MNKVIIGASALLFVSNDVLLMILLAIFCFTMCIWAYKRAKQDKGYKDG